jgi:hypothetical protein
MKQQEKDTADVKAGLILPTEKTKIAAEGGQISDSPLAGAVERMNADGSKVYITFPKKTEIQTSLKEVYDPVSNSYKYQSIDPKTGAAVGALGATAKPGPTEKTKEEKNPYQPEVTSLMTQNAKKKSIANQLQADLEEFRNAKTEDEKIRIGNTMIKTLNSKEGADAVGVDERKNIANALEYQKFNFFNPGKAFGRDLPGFEDQVIATINGVQGGIDLNNKAIADLTKGYQGLKPPPTSRVAERTPDKPKGGAIAAPAPPAAALEEARKRGLIP